MSSIDKQIESLLQRFDKTVVTDDYGQIQGKVAFETMIDYLNYCPQYIEVLEKLLPLLNKNSPGGTKRALHIMVDKPQEAFFIGNEEYAIDEWLVIELTLPAQAKDTTEPTPHTGGDSKKKKERPEVTAIKTFVATFARSQQDFNGVIAITFK